MHIAISGRIFLHPHLEGIGWYTDQMIRCMAEIRPDYKFSVIMPAGRNFGEAWPGNVQIITAGFQRFDAITVPWWLYVTLPRVVQRLKPDILWVPDGVAPPHRLCPTVVTIHDVSPMVIPEAMRKRDRLYFRHYIKKTIRQADHLFTVSEYSKQEILDHYHIPNEKITVTYNAPRAIFRPLENDEINEVRSSLTNGAPYFVHVGAIQPRKNIGSVLRAFDALCEQLTSEKPHLVLIGRKAWKSGATLSQLESSPYRERIHLTSYVSEEKLANYIGAANALINFSNHEGFGMSVLEGMACGVPVICSKKGALPEIGGEAALYADNETDLVQKMKSVLESAANLEEMRVFGFEQIKKFRWNMSARTGITVFGSLIKMV